MFFDMILQSEQNFSFKIKSQANNIFLKGVERTVVTFCMVIKYTTVLHARLRRKCRNSNNDVFINHLRQDTTCSWCNGVEDAAHHLFYSKSNRNQTQVLFNIIRKLLQESSNH